MRRLTGASQVDLIRKHYGEWAATYGQPDDDGWFAHVRARERRLVENLLELRGGESVLDVGCGSGIYACALKERGHEVWAIDLCPEMIERVRGRVDRAEVGDVQSLDLGRTFDRILCLGVMDYVSDAVPALRRLREHLSPEGRAVVLVPRFGIGGFAYRREKLKHGLQVHLYTLDELEASAAQAGLACLGHRRPFFHNFVMVFGPRGA